MRFAPLVPKPKPNTQARQSTTNFARRAFTADVETDGSDSWPPHAWAEQHDNFSFGAGPALGEVGGRTPIRAKLEVGGANEPLEREADAVADRVMRMPAPRAESIEASRPKGDIEPDAQTDAESDLAEQLTEAPTLSAFAGGAALPGGREFVAQRKCASCEPEDDEIHRSLGADLLQRDCDSCAAEDEIQRACASCDSEEEIQRAGASCDSEEEIMPEPAAGRGGGATSDEFSARVRGRARSGGMPLPNHARGFLEPRLGVDLGDLRVHVDKEAALLSKWINARAFTLDEDIFFAQGEWQPQTQAGMRLLTHEVAHTLQNRRNEDAPGPHPLSRIMRWKCPVTIVTMPEDKRGNVENCLTNMGVTKIGDLAKPLSWDDSKLDNTFKTLQKMRKGGGSLGPPNWVVTSWNKGRDDLKHMSSILDYVALLNDMTQNSMNLDYVEAVEAMGSVVIAGVVIKKINPRSIYFVAAAQVGMDVRGGTESGRGHFVPVAGFQQEIVSLVKQLKIIDLGKKTKIKEGKKKKTVYEVVPGSKDAYNYIVERVLFMDKVLAAQKNNEEIMKHMASEKREAAVAQMIPGYNPSEHREPALRAMFESKRKSIAKLKIRAADDADAKDHATDVLEVLGGAPSRAGDTGVGHQWGSVDPHGSDHAAGIGIDIFKARGKGADGKHRQWTNSGFKDRADIVHWVINNYGLETHDPKTYWPEYGYEPLPLGVDDLPNIWLTNISSGQARSLSLLIYNHVDDIREWQTRAKQPAKIPEGLVIPEGKEKAHLKAAQAAFHTLQKSIYLAASVRWSAVNTHLGKTKQANALGQSTLTAAEFLLRQLENLKDTAKQLDPDALVARLTITNAMLELAADEAQRKFEILTLQAEQEATTDAAKLESEESFARGWAKFALLIAQLKREWARTMDPKNKLSKSELNSWKRAKRQHKKKMKSIPKNHRDKRKKMSKAQKKASDSRAAALAVFESILPNKRRLKLDKLRDDLENMSLTAKWAHEQDALDAINATKGGLEKWLQDVGDPERGLYDQSEVMIDAMNDVRSHSDSDGTNTHVQSGHHWEIAAQQDRNETRDILLRDNDYIHMLKQDMMYRKEKGQLQRVLETMAESAGGRELLTGGRGSHDFEPALRDVMGTGTDAMLANVKAKVIDPYKLGIGETLANNPEMALKIAMRDRGFYME